MSALTTERKTTFRTVQRDKRPISANVKAYKGGRVAVDADGFYCPATGAATEVVLDAVFGETVDNTGGADGAKNVEVFWFKERVVFLQANDTGTALDVTDRERECFQLDDQTVTGDNTKASAGVVYDVTSEGVWVEGA
jgi:hypothetical protein